MTHAATYLELSSFGVFQKFITMDLISKVIAATYQNTSHSNSDQSIQPTFWGALLTNTCKSTLLSTYLGLFSEDYWRDQMGVGLCITFATLI